jgi:hypothetical protein
VWLVLLFSLSDTSRLRLIDCQTRKVITALPNTKYAALSYVWGAPPPTHLSDTIGQRLWSDLHGCPKVISDSLQVALDLNIQYLWVDRYCINQYDDQDKSIQIHQMDSIYEMLK